MATWWSSLKTKTFKSLYKRINSDNGRICKSVEEAKPSDTSAANEKFPQKVVMLGITGSDGQVLPPIWIDGTLDAKKYKKILIDKVLPTLDVTYGVIQK